MRGSVERECSCYPAKRFAGLLGCAPVVPPTSRENSPLSLPRIHGHGRSHRTPLDPDSDPGLDVEQNDAGSGSDIGSVIEIVEGGW